MNGFLLLDKPEGLTSAQCVYKLRNTLGIKRIGHCGTLDPLATGLLPICIGEATKFSNYATNLDKVYEVEIKFGIETNTGDITGQIIAEKGFNVSDQFLKEHLALIKGINYQIPPMYSAIKKNGKPLYYWARKGVCLYRESRKIRVKDIKLIYRYENLAKLKVYCSKGTYVRALVEQLGRNMESLATVSSLKRLEVGHLNLGKNFCTLNDSKELLEEKILPCDTMLRDFNKIELNLEDVKKVRNGLSIDYNANLEKKGLVRIYTKDNLFLGLGLIGEENKIQPKRLLSTN